MALMTVIPGPSRVLSRLQRPLREHWVRVRGLPVHSRMSDRVESPDVVLVHGVGVSSRYMIPTARRLADHCRVWAPDLPGFGRSAKPRTPLRLHELAEALGEWLGAAGIGRAALVGNSFGCQIIVELAVRRPDLVDRVVLQGPTVDPDARSWRGQLARWVRNAPYERPAMSALIAADYWDAGLARVFHTFRDALDDPIERKLPAVTAPALVVRGEKDPIVPQRWAEDAARLLPKGRLVVVEGAHTLNFAAPDPFVAAILPFLLEPAP
jgi:2-hydroxy-6-oxonona-2,4-dienedioate hydrolase